MRKVNNAAGQASLVLKLDWHTAVSQQKAFKTTDLIWELHIVLLSTPLPLELDKGLLLPCSLRILRGPAAIRYAD